MSRTIRTAAEIDALPVWAAIRGEDFTEWVRFPAKPDAAGGWVSEYGDRATSAELEPRVYGLVVLNDPSTPAVQSVVPEVAPSATCEVVEAAIFEADDECVLEVHEVRSLASRLLARFNITPKEPSDA